MENKIKQGTILVSTKSHKITGIEYFTKDKEYKVLCLVYDYVCIVDNVGIKRYFLPVYISEYFKLKK